MIYWFYETRWGTFAIVSKRNRFVAMFEDEELGSYHSPQAALDDLVGIRRHYLPR
jgi:hypothetical protein